MTDATLADQITDIVRENQNLRVKSDNDDKTIHLMRQQYDSLAAEVDGIRDKAAREIRALITERDQAVRKFKEIDTTLMQAAEIILQAARARVGNGTTPAPPPAITDDRLPEVALQ
jgi:hypothetical protein